MYIASTLYVHFIVFQHYMENLAFKWLRVLPEEILYVPGVLMNI